MRLLLGDYKADIEAKTGIGQTALYTVCRGGNEAVIGLVLEDYKAKIKTDNGEIVGSSRLAARFSFSVFMTLTALP